MSDDQDVSGKTVVITGASSGFGRGTAERLGALGANVVLVARRGDLLDEIVAAIRDGGGSAHAVVADVSDSDDVARVASAAVERYGHIDVWVNNVGVGAIGMFWDIPIQDHARLIDVNLKGLIYGAHISLTHFRARGRGVLINVGSVDSAVPLAYQASYAASKAAVLSLSRSLNEELRLVGDDDTIKVGTIMPWAVDTPWWTHAANYSGRTARMAAMDDPALVVDAIVAACTDPKEEQPVGGKARAADVSHHLLPGLTERLSAKIADAESKSGARLPATAGSLYEPMPEGTTVDGAIRARMKREDSADDDH
jgi:short-subunit dehydrogenase